MTSTKKKEEDVLADDTKGEEGGRNMNTQDDAVVIRKLDFRYKEKKVLSDVSMSLPRGSRCLLVGDNGAGKTTLLRIVGGKHHIISDGEKNHVSILGHESMFSPKLNLLRSYLGGDWGKRTVAFVGYGVPMTADIDVKDLMTDLQNEFPERREKLYKLLDIDEEWNMSCVSDGQRRRVQIMLGLLRPFELLLLDEITTDLDVVTRQDLLGFLKEETETRNVTIVYATHIFDGLDHWPTHVLCLHRGKVHRQGTYAEVIGEMSDPKCPRLMASVAKWIRGGRAESKERGHKTSGASVIRPDGSAGGFAPGRLARFMAYA